MNPNVGTTINRVRDFIRMNPLEFHGSRIEGHPQEFANEVYKVFMIMSVMQVLLKFGSTNGRKQGS